MGSACECCHSPPFDGNDGDKASDTPRKALGWGLDVDIATEEQNLPCPGVTPSGGVRRSVHRIRSGFFGLKNFCRINPGKLEDCFNMETKILGKGGYGSVRLGVDKATNVTFAIKSLQKEALLEDDQHLAQFNEEVEIMRLVDHPNIIRFRECFEDYKEIFVVLEYCAGGDLLEAIGKETFFSEASAGRCIHQMLLAVNYLHHNSIAHRDIKPENWLLSTRESIASAKLKLIDFGFAKRFHPGMLMETQCGTPFYIAPEVLMGEYDERVDVWSAGVLSYLLLSGKLPFMARTTTGVLEAVINLKLELSGPGWDSISDIGKQALLLCLERDYEARPSAQAILAHPWFERIHDESTGAVSRGNSSPSNGLIDTNNLQAFTSMHTVKKAALTIIATQLTDDSIEKLRKEFIRMDDNMDGTLSLHELKKGMAILGAELPPDIDSMVEKIDSDGSGAIDYTEFLAATLDHRKGYQKDVVWQAFKRFDMDGSGSISRKELRNVLGMDEVQGALNLNAPKTAEELDNLFDLIDVDHNGTIDFNEFFQMLNNYSYKSEAGTRSQNAGAIRTSERPSSTGNNKNTSAKKLQVALGKANSLRSLSNSKLSKHKK